MRPRRRARRAASPSASVARPRSVSCDEAAAAVALVHVGGADVAEALEPLDHPRRGAHRHAGALRELGRAERAAGEGREREVLRGGEALPGGGGGVPALGTGQDEAREGAAKGVEPVDDVVERAGLLRHLSRSYARDRPRGQWRL